METELFNVVGKKNGQLVEINELPMSSSNCWKWIKEQNIEAYYSAVCLIPYHGFKPELIP